MLSKKQKLTKKAHIRYLIGYDSSNIYRIWNASKNKVIRTRDIIFDENSCYDSTNIDLNQLISEPFIETDLLESIQSDPIEAIEIDSDEELELDPHLPKSKSHNNVESSDQTTLHVSDLNTEMSTPAFNTSSDSKSNTITLIPFNRPLAKVETVQQNNSTKPRSSNKSSTNIAFQATEISASLDASNIISEKVKCSKKQTTQYQAHYTVMFVFTYST